MRPGTCLPAVGISHAVYQEGQAASGGRPTSLHVAAALYTTGVKTPQAVWLAAKGVH